MMLQVNVSGGMGIAHQLHRGTWLSGVTLRAGGSMGNLRHDCVIPQTTCQP